MTIKTVSNTQPELPPKITGRLSNWTGGLLDLRVRPVEVVTLCLYAALLAWAIPHHEAWADEAQAWQIARNLPLAQIFRVLAYEGHPGVWYVFLWVLTRLHVSYSEMHWVVAGIAVTGVALLLLASPLPRFVKLLLPFTFYLAFQYAIVARSYVLVPLLIFVCAMFWPQRLQRPLTIALCLGLLANVAPHAAAISGGFAIVYLIDLWLRRKDLKLLAPAWRLFAGAMLLLAFYGASVWAAWPARDAGGAAFAFKPGQAQNVALEEQQSVLPPLYPRPEPANKKSLHWAAWKVESRLSGSLTEGLIHPFWLGCLFWVLLAVKLFRTRQLHYLIPAFFLVLLSHVYAWFWHSGLMLPCVIGLLWMTWPQQFSRFRKLPLYEQLPLLMLLVIALVQISWAEFAFQFDYAHDYASGQKTATFLRPYVLSHARIVSIGNDFISVAVQPYFNNNIFLNQPSPFYWWSTHNLSKLRYKQILPQHPEIVVLDWRFHDFPTDEFVAGIPLAKQLVELGYRNTQTFCGGLVHPGREILEWNCDLIYQAK